MKIVFIITGLKRGGAELMLLRLIEGLDKSFSPFLITLRKGGDLLEEFRSLGIPIIELGLNPKLPSIFKLYRLTKILRQINPEVIQTWMYHADLLGGLAARYVGIKKVIWGIRNSFTEPNKLSFTTRVVIKLNALLSPYIPSQIVYCSEKSLTPHFRIGYPSSKFIVIPNGFQSDKFQKDIGVRKVLRNELSISNDDKVVGMVARFDPQKNHLGLLEAASHVLEKMHNVKFVLVGKGVNNNTLLMDYLTKLKLKKNSVLLLEARTDIFKFLNIFDVLVSASHSESFPNTIGEAMSCGIPCVSTNAGDSRSIIGDTGIVVDTGDMQALSRGILEILSLSSDEYETLSKKARSKIISNYAIATIVSRYEDLYRLKDICAG